MKQLRVVARITRRTKRLDPNAIEHLSCIQHDRIDDARQRSVGSGCNHYFDHRPKHGPEEEVLGIGEEFCDGISRAGRSARERSRVFHRLPHGVLRRGCNEVVLLRKIMLLRAARDARTSGHAAGAEAGVSILCQEIDRRR